MKKRLIALGLVLTMTMSVSAIAFANPQDADSEAGIEFVFDGLEGVFPGDPGPEDPDQPGPGPGPWPGLNPIDIHFGEQEISADDESYDSRENGLDWGQAAGIQVVSLTDFQIDVGISTFVTVEAGAANNGYETIRGFELELESDDGALSVPTTEAVAHVANIAAGETDTVMTGEVEPGSVGRAGANFGGILDVLGGTAHLGEAQADLTWYFIRN